MKKLIPFGEWLPDQPDLGNAVTSVRNAIPGAASYKSIGELATVTNALDSACLGAVWAQNSAGDYYYFAGDAGKLYRLSVVTFNNVSKSGNYTSTGWEFVKWDQRIIAVSIDEPPQYFDMGTSTLFADLPGSPPKAKHAAVVRDFIVLGNLDEGGTVRPSRLRWSGFNNSEQWQSSQATQSDSQDLLGRGGAIQKIVPGETGLIIQEHSIRRMTYVGPPLIFRIDEIEKDRGTQAPNSVAWSGNKVFFLSHDGFYMKDGDAPSVPIGSEKVDNFFNDDFSGVDMDSIRAAVDRENKIIAWCYPSRETGVNRVLMYRWDIQRWTVVDQDAKILLEYVTPSYSLDELDVILPAGIDTDSIVVDSSQYSGGSVALGAFNGSHQLCTFTGSPLTATIETAEIEGPEGYRVSVKSARPLSDGTTSLCVGTRDNQNDNYSYGAAVSRNIKGEMDFRTSARFHRLKATISGGFDDAQGVAVYYREEGRR